MEKLIEAGANVDTNNCYGNTALILAARKGILKNHNFNFNLFSHRKRADFLSSIQTNFSDENFLQSVSITFTSRSLITIENS